MLSVNSSTISKPVISKQKSYNIQNTNISTEQKEQTIDITNSYYPPAFKGKVPDKLIIEGNIKEKISKLDILNDSEGLDKLLKEYTNDMDKCLLAKSYKEYETTRVLVNKKWQGLLDKITTLTAHEETSIAEQADNIMGEKFVPALLHFQEIFSKMDNTPMVRQGYMEELNASKITKT